ncbi:hypothetical protein AB1E22_06065 [Buttiauxella gaviniae]|uniref:Uncharacterized protein n=1 Tax=Buttiauxella gaviniae TaxID=82990 RepID=A0ABV3NRX7_9ENTR
MRLFNKMCIIIFTSLLSIKTSAGDLDNKKQNFIFCAKIDTEAVSDLFDHFKKKYKNDDTFILLGSNSEELNYTEGNSRATIEGYIYIMNTNLLKLDSLSVLTIKNRIPTDTITYISHKNKILGGIFYSNEFMPLEEKTKAPANLIYIGNAGDIFHLKTYQFKDKECSSRFPKEILANFIDD